MPQYAHSNFILRFQLKSISLSVSFVGIFFFSVEKKIIYCIMIINEYLTFSNIKFLNSIYSGSKNPPSSLYSSFFSFFFALWQTTLELLLGTSSSTLCRRIYAIHFSFVFLSIFIFLKNEKIHMNS